MWKNSLKNVESDNNKILYETLLDFCLQLNGTYFLNKTRIYLLQKICTLCTKHTTNLPKYTLVHNEENVFQVMFVCIEAFLESRTEQM